MKLYLDICKIPRTVTRAEWKEIHRWRRIVTRQLKKDVQHKMDMLAVYGTTMLPEMKEDLLNEMINPPLLLGPYQ